MKTQIPEEQQRLITAFLAEEDAQKKQALPKTKKKAQRRLVERIQSGTVFTSEELQKFAKANGWKHVRTSGSHLIFERTDNSGETMTIPKDGGQQKTIQPDTGRRILERIFPNYLKKK